MTVSLSNGKPQGKSARAFEAISGYTGWLTGKRLGIGIAFVALYLIAERLTLIHEIAPLNITPWNPAAGMAVALLLAGGFVYTPFVLSAELLSSIFIDQAPYGLLAATVPAVLLALGLVILAYVIRFVLHFNLPVISLPDTVLLVTAVPCLVAIFALAFCAARYATGLIPNASFPDTAWSFWVGTASGIVTVIPVATAVLSSRQNQSRVSYLAALPDLMPYLAGTGAASGLILALGKDAGTQYFYLSFPPIVWLAIRQGYALTSLALLVTHTVLSALMVLDGYQRHEFVANQVLMLVLSATGLLLGAVVTERQIALERARKQGAELARMSRIVMAGAMGSALAHEISQPLSTISAYVHAARRLLRDELSRGSQAGDALMQVEAEAARARRILERVRDCVSLGRVVAAPADIVEIAQKIVHSCSGAPFIKVTGAANVPKVMADTVQIEQALLNLITNALDAVSHRTDRAGIVHVHLSQRLGRIAVEISDDGPGIAEEMQERLFEPFETTKSNGMGLGLFLSRQIAEAHGGSLSWRRLEPQGTCFILEIPIDGPTQYRAR